MPFDLQFVLTPSGGISWPEEAVTTRTVMLADIMINFGYPVPLAPTVDVPEHSVFNVQVYPNPFNPNTKITYTLPHDGELSIAIYNIRGELLRVLVDERVPAGPGTVVWDGTDNDGRGVSSGVYLCQIRASGQEAIR